MAPRPTIAVFLRHLARLVRLGAPLDAGLRVLAAAAPERGVRRAATAIRAGVAAGKPLHECLADHPRWFPPAVVAAVARGEGDALAETLEATAGHTDVVLRARRRSRVDLAYLGVVLALFVFALVARLGFAQQIFGFRIFGTMGDSSPSLGSSWMDWGLVLLVPLGLTAATTYRLVAHRRGAPWLDDLKLAVPWFGPAVRLEQVAPFLHQVGLLLGRGWDEARALAESLPVLRNRTLEAAGRALLGTVEGGVRLADALRDGSLLTPVERAQLDTGSAGGRLPAALCALGADLLARSEARARLTHVAAGPVLVLLVGSLVGATLARWLLGLAA